MPGDGAPPKPLSVASAIMSDMAQPTLFDPSQFAVADAVRRTAAYPRLRYMGSKYRLIPHLAEVFTEIGGHTALDGQLSTGP